MTKAELIQYIEDNVQDDAIVMKPGKAIGSYQAFYNFTVAWNHQKYSSFGNRLND